MPRDDDPVGFNFGDARRIDRSVNWTERQRVDIREPRKRQVFPGDDIGQVQDVLEADGCGCCRCFNCLDRYVSPITECAECADGAAAVYVISVGPWVLLLAYDAGCVWKSDEQTIDGGVYQWVLTQAGDATTLELVWISGDDPLELDPGMYGATNELVYTAVAPWTCRCGSKMAATNPDRFPTIAGLKCQICVEPQPAACACCFEITTTGDYNNAHLNFAELTGTFQFTWSAVYDPEEAVLCIWDQTVLDPTVNWGLVWYRDLNEIHLRNGAMSDASEDLIYTLEAGEEPCGDYTLTNVESGDSIDITVIDCPDTGGGGGCTGGKLYTGGEVGLVDWTYLSGSCSGTCGGTCEAPAPTRVVEVAGELVGVSCGCV